MNSRPELSLRSQVGDPADETQGGVRGGSRHGEIVINRPPAEVFDVVADTSKEPEYNPRSLSSATHMPSMDLHRTPDPDPEGTPDALVLGPGTGRRPQGTRAPSTTFGLDDIVRYGWTLLGETPNEEVVFGQIGRPWKPVGASAGIPAT